jgi:dTDP-4-amino-4,6-dideoxygalactose transaminase
VKIPLVNVAENSRRLEAPLGDAVGRVLRSGSYILGDELGGFEQEIAAYLGVSHAMGVSCGTDALVCALSALGIGSGDEVLTTPFTFVATAEAIARVGARPRFVDIDEDTLLIDIVDAPVGPRTKAIIPVHLFGQRAPLPALGIPVIEDSAQAIGRGVGASAALACFSFFPSKPLGAAGDGGLVVTNDSALADRVRALRQHGATAKHRYEMLGGNYRLDALQAAILRVKLPHLDGWLARRRELAAAYTERLRSVRTPAPDPHGSWAHYVIRVPAARRDGLQANLRENGIETAVYYPTPLHLQPVFAYLGHRESDFPVAERAAQEVLALPLYPELALSDLEYVVQCIERYLA